VVTSSDGVGAEALDLSLIIATRDRCQKLAKLFQKINLLKFDSPWELIIVDNGSLDDTATVVRQFISESAVTTVYIFEPHLGKSNSLNRAIEIARGKILAFTDDDCYPAPNFIRCLLPAFDDPSIGFISGRVVLHDPTDFPTAINDSLIPAEIPRRSFLTNGTPLIGANFAFRRQVLLDIGGFDPLFGPGALCAAAEDLEVASRASATGWRGQYHPEVLVEHHHGRKKSDGPRLMRSYGIGIGAYHMKLLLACHEYRWFARSVLQIPRRYKMSRRMLMWEPVGAAKYICQWAVKTARDRLVRS
jgi:glycosyltransferase involved in cell wall biosynthesis